LSTACCSLISTGEKISSFELGKYKISEIVRFGYSVGQARQPFMSFYDMGYQVEKILHPRSCQPSLDL
jgi:hypothetical protein